MLRVAIITLVGLSLGLGPLLAGGPAGHAADCCGMAPITAPSDPGDCCAAPGHEATACGPACLWAAAVAGTLGAAPAPAVESRDIAAAAAAGRLPPGPDPSPPKPTFPA
jgi:hypothetical protein